MGSTAENLALASHLLQQGKVTDVEEDEEGRQDQANESPHLSSGAAKSTDPIEVRAQILAS